MIVVLTGGTGGAKFIEGLRQVVPAEEITLIVNTGDDLVWWGLNISPDIDSVMYALAGLLSKERGWGVSGDTFYCLESTRSMKEPAWFHVGDRDLAVHLLRTRLLREGWPLSKVTAEIAARLGVASRVLPMTDAVVETRVDTPSGEMSFQEYFVKRWYQDPVNAVRFAGAQSATAAPGVLEVISDADAIVFAPSNPVTSIGPILAVPGIRETLARAKAPLMAISPIINGQAVSGPAAILMKACGMEASTAGIAKLYDFCLDVLVIDEKEATQPAHETGIEVCTTNTVMKTLQNRADLAGFALEALRRHAQKSGRESLR